jgi:hypothetical protein
MKLAIAKKDHLQLLLEPRANKNMVFIIE